MSSPQAKHRPFYKAFNAQLGAEIRRLREERGLSATTVGALLGIQPQQLTARESGAAPWSVAELIAFTATLADLNLYDTQGDPVDPITLIYLAAQRAIEQVSHTEQPYDPAHPYISLVDFKHVAQLDLFDIQAAAGSPANPQTPAFAATVVSWLAGTKTPSPDQQSRLQELLNDYYLKHLPEHMPPKLDFTPLADIRSVDCTIVTRLLDL